MARIVHGTLTANEVEVVELDASGYSTVEIINIDGSASIYLRIDGQDPVVGGDDCDVIPAVVGSIVLDASDTVLVRLISVGSPQYSVKGW